jgi:ABC-type Fe3+/spermidine/putrescine transport system ATPase subunit
VKPAVLLLDEPLSNLDANLREEMRFEIRRLHDEFKITTVYVTHDQAEAMVTSDRIAVMNAGRIEQIDAPYTLYTKPKTRFVAGFIGRTNFLEAERSGGDIRFDRFAVRAERFPDIDAFGSKLVFSVRPQAMTLHRQPPANGDRRLLIEGHLLERAYLGEHWDYVFAPQESGLRLRITATPTQVFEVNERLWLDIDPQQMAPIS